jgi:hypothetical protein
VSRSRAAALRVLLALWLLLIAAVTLAPTSPTPPLTLGRFLCIGCGDRDTADVIANWLLFVPLGALAALVVGARRGVLAAAGLTLAVEFVQIGIPGRYPALQDLLFNSLGAVAGAAVALRGLGPLARRALAFAVAGAWLAPTVLLVPMTSPSELYGLWTPSFGGVEQYRGRVLRAFVGGFLVRNGLVSGRASLDSALVERRAIEVLVEVGPPPSTVAPIFHVADGRRTTVLSLGARDHDLLLVGHNPAQALGLHQPAARWRGGLAALAPGDTVRLLIERDRGSTCMSAGARAACGLAPSLADGWGHLVSLDSAPPSLHTLVDILWVAGLGALLGLTASSLEAAAARGAALAAAGLVLSALSPDVRLEWPSAFLLAVTTLVAFLAGTGGRRREPPAPDEAGSRPTGSV